MWFAMRLRTCRPPLIPRPGQHAGTSVIDQCQGNQGDFDYIMTDGIVSIALGRNVNEVFFFFFVNSMGKHINSHLTF